MLYEKMLTAVEETSTFGLEWGPLTFPPTQFSAPPLEDEEGSRNESWALIQKAGFKVWFLV